MPVGTPKATLFGGKAIVPGGTETFNSPGTFSIPTGIEEVTVAGRGGTGNPGNSGYAGNAGGGGNGGGGGRAFATQYGDSGQPQFDGPGAFPSWIRKQTFSPPSGGAGSGGTGTSGTPGNSGTSGASSTALGSTFPGGAGGTGGTGGTGGSAGNPGSEGTLVINFRRTNSTGSAMRHNRSSDGGTRGYDGTPGGNVHGGFGNSYNATGFKAFRFSGYQYNNLNLSPSPYQNYPPSPATPPIGNSNVGAGGGGAGVTNPGLAGPAGGTGGAGGNPGGGVGGINHNIGLVANGISYGYTGGNATVSRAGGGGGGGNRATTGYSTSPDGLQYGSPDSLILGGGGGGGGRGSGAAGSAGNPGNPGSLGTPGSSLTPVSPGTNAPITVGSGGFVTISWNPQ